MRDSERNNEETGNLSTIARIDERTKAILQRLEAIEKSQRDDYVTQKEFAPIRSIVYGLVSVILLTVLGGILALVMHK